jgi:hypothetical protein
MNISRNVTESAARSREMSQRKPTQGMLCRRSGVKASDADRRRAGPKSRSVSRSAPPCHSRPTEPSTGRSPMTDEGREPLAGRGKRSEGLRRVRPTTIVCYLALISHADMITFSLPGVWPHHVNRWVLRKKADGHQHEAGAAHRHDRPVFRPRKMCLAQGIPNNHITVFNFAVRLNPPRQSLTALIHAHQPPRGVQLVRGVRRDPEVRIKKSEHSTHRRIGMKFWDASTIVPLLMTEPTTKGLQTLAEKDPGMIVWWATEVECASAIARLERADARRRYFTD